ncbi:oleate-activated transcription factor [Martiniozyma asiatica (nom. inval.)]|nr:oleate-activated transcription factor [Martiniozyma asiatica]
MPSNMPKVKKRHRLPTSCLQCRKKKLKCDRGKPCHNCIKSGIQNICRYSTTAEENQEDASTKEEQIITLSNRIKILEEILKVNNIDLSNYNQWFSNTSTLQESDDPVISFTDTFDGILVKENRIIHLGSTSILAFIIGDRKLNKVFSLYHKAHLKKYKEYLNGQNIKACELKLQSRLSKTSMSAPYTDSNPSGLLNLDEIQLTAYSGISQAKLIKEQLDKINAYLPSFEIISALIDNFFKFVYPMFPFIDETVFREQIKLILLIQEDGGCQLGITHFQHVSIISLLLIVLRFSYISIKNLDMNMSLDLNDPLAKIIQSNTKIECIFVINAKALLFSLPSHDNIFKNVTLRNIQVLLYLRLHQTFSPELSDETCEHSQMLITIIQMVRSIGANLDIDQLPLLNKDPREANIWRRIFYKLLSLDVQGFFKYGTPLTISNTEWSVQLPHLEEADKIFLNEFKNETRSKKLQEIVLENSINNEIALEFEFYKIAKEALEMFQNYQKGFRKSELLKIVKKLEDFTKTIPEIYEMIYQPNKFRSELEKLFEIPLYKKFEIRITSMVMCFSFYYLLYLNEIETNDSSIDSLKFSAKATEISMIIFKIYHDFSGYMNRKFSIDTNPSIYKMLSVFFRNTEIFFFPLFQLDLQGHYFGFYLFF